MPHCCSSATPPYVYPFITTINVHAARATQDLVLASRPTGRGSCSSLPRLAKFYSPLTSLLLSGGDRLYSGASLLHRYTLRYRLQCVPLSCARGGTGCAATPPIRPMHVHFLHLEVP